MTDRALHGRNSQKEFINCTRFSHPSGRHSL